MMEFKPKKLVRFDESQHIEKPLPVEGGKRYIALSKYEGGGGGGGDEGEGGTTLNNVDGRSRRKNVGMGVGTTNTTAKFGGGRFIMVMPAPAAAAAGAAAEKQQPQRPKSQLWILDPASQVYVQWNRVFLFWCLVGLFVDPLFFYVPSVVKEEEDAANGVSSSCMDTDLNLGITVTCFRTFADIFYLLHILVKLRTAYVSPSSRVFGKGELVTDANKIAARYLKSDFFIDLIAALPLPQVVIWFITPAVKASKADNTNNALALIVLLQYVPRLYLIFPLSSEIIKANGVVTKTAWAGAAYNLLLYLLASHVLGASWYLISIERHATCWKSVCRGELAPVKCSLAFLDCDSSSTNDDRRLWRNITQVFSSCDPGNPSSSFQYGIFGNAVSQNVVSTDFLEKYLYCLWWGLQNLSSYGQSLSTTTFVWETLFAILIACLGLVLFAHLIGNMQTYLQSITVRFEEWRLKQRDTEEWMRHRRLPENLQERVRRFDQFKWIATRGVDEEFILRALPKDLRRDIRRHLCLDLVLRVPFFSQMDGQLLDAICERLVSRLSTQGSYIVREGEPVTEILFIIRGRLESSTTNGGRAGFFNSIGVGAGGVCGDELLAWALLSKSALNLPSSTRTVKALEEVEAFALPAEDLKFVANQFRRLHSRKLQHTFRFYSDHWRTWAACFIQAAWRRFKRRMMAKSLSMSESLAFLGVDEQAAHDEASPAAAATQEDQEEDHIAIIGSSNSSSIHSSSSTSRINQNLGVTLLASRFAANTRRGALRSKDVEIPTMPELEKPPVDPDFSLDQDDC